MYKQPNVDSSYKNNDIGRTIYTVVMALKPSLVIEVGTLYGYSAICIGQALRDLGGDRKLICFDLWDDYKYKHTTMGNTYKNIINCGLDDYIVLKKGSINEAISYFMKYTSIENNVLFHIDISNNGDIIRMIKNSVGKYSNVIFEGGTAERDRVAWMDKYGKPPILGSCEYKVIDERFPGLSML
jgi:cephalosporin hydroxylase